MLALLQRFPRRFRRLEDRPLHRHQPCRTPQHLPCLWVFVREGAEPLARETLDLGVCESVGGALAVAEVGGGEYDVLTYRRDADASSVRHEASYDDRELIGRDVLLRAEDGGGEQQGGLREEAGLDVILVGAEVGDLLRREE